MFIPDSRVAKFYTLAAEEFQAFVVALKVSRSRNKIVEP